MSKFVIIPYVIYPFDLYVTNERNYEKIKESVKEIISEDVWNEIDELKGDYDARTLIFSSGQTIIVLKKINHGLIAHESLHAVHFLMDKIGQKLTFASDESYCYLLQYIVDKIYENFKIPSKQ